MTNVFTCELNQSVLKIKKNCKISIFYVLDVTHVKSENLVLWVKFGMNFPSQLPLVSIIADPAHDSSFIAATETAVIRLTRDGKCSVIAGYDNHTHHCIQDPPTVNASEGTFIKITQIAYLPAHLRFDQLVDGQILVVDQEDHCLKSLSASLDGYQLPDPYIGLCGTPGDPARGRKLLHYPVNVQISIQNTYEVFLSIAQDKLARSQIVDYELNPWKEKVRIALKDDFIYEYELFSPIYEADFHENILITAVDPTTSLVEDFMKFGFVGEHLLEAREGHLIIASTDTNVTVKWPVNTKVSTTAIDLLYAYSIDTGIIVIGRKMFLISETRQFDIVPNGPEVSHHSYTLIAQGFVCSREHFSSKMNIRIETCAYLCSKSSSCVWFTYAESSLACDLHTEQMFRPRKDINKSCYIRTYRN